MHILYTAKR